MSKIDDKNHRRKLFAIYISATIFGNKRDVEIFFPEPIKFGKFKERDNNSVYLL